ncbi:MAG: hypothetical protein C4539_15510 [Ignavibacteriales bacterium]|nr:MAG: hypothetical protein C4539_15510 [Ignavibacteriales bacterium]
MELWIGAINLGFLYSFMALGVFITYKIYDFADITVDGSFTTGASVAAVLIVGGMDPFFVLILSFLAGAAAGFLTGFIHTKFKINGLLAGILVMTGLYSVNLRIMGKSNIPLLNSPSFVSYFEKFNPDLNSEIWLCICLVVFIAITWLIISVFFKTDFGISMRATGDNPIMVSAAGVNVNFMKIFGIALANGLVGISGALVSQYQGFADIGMGVGAIVFSLASVIIGEALIKKTSILVRTLSVIVGSIIFRLMVALALYVGLDPNDLKLITAVFVFFTLVASQIFGFRKKKFSLVNSVLYKKRKILAVVFISAAVITGVYFLIFGLLTRQPEERMVKIGIVIPNDATILTLTRDGFYQEMKKLGYQDGVNCKIIEKNANGDIPTISTIIDNFINQDIDIYLTISTPSTQAAAKKIKNKPVVFATVANPFIIGVGKTDTDHPANITGVYGTAPIKELLEIIKKIHTGKMKFGVIWNAAFPNSVYNVKQLENYISEDKNFSMAGATIANSSEVYQAAQSLAGKGIDAFFLTPDIMVYASFESIVKVARANKIPIYSNDVERLADGALAVYGYEYLTSGYQAARIIDKIIKGQNPSAIPYEIYNMTTIGINLDEEKKLGIKIPDDVKAEATATVENGKLNKKELSSTTNTISGKQKRLTLMQFTDNTLLNTTAEGIVDELNRSGVLTKNNIVIDKKNPNGDFGVAQSLAKDIVSKNYDYVITVSTIAAQVMFGNNKSIPHIFCAVTDPIKSGLIKTFKDHASYVTGLATPQPVESTIKLMREVFPKAKTIGIVWNAAESNSEYCTLKARDACKKFGFRLIERTITNSNEIDEAVKSLVNEKIDLFFTSGDVTVTVVVPSIAKTMIRNKIPYITNTPADVNDGVLFALGADYYDVGKKAATVFERFMQGEKISGIDVEKYVPEKLAINLTTAKQIGYEVPENIIKKAAVIKK